jgi:hypothetical protein
MAKQYIEGGPAPRVTVSEIGGDLQVRGWEPPQIAVHADPDTMSFEQQDDQVALSCSADCDLRLPLGAALTLDSVKGDASIKFLEDQLIIVEVRGDCDVRHVAGCKIDFIHGDLTVKSASEDLHVGTVKGDADVRDVNGDLALDEVSGNLDAQNVEGSLNASAGGNARLRLPALTGGAYNIRAAGNIYCYLPEDANLRIQMSSDGGVIKVRTSQSSKTYQQSDYQMALGAGEVPMSLHSGGAIYLFVERPGWPEGGPQAGGFAALPDDFGQQVAHQVETQIQQQMDEMTRRINEQMERLSDRLGRAGFSPEETERIVGQALGAGEQASARAQEKMRRAQEKLERKLEAHRRRGEARNPAASDRRSRRQSWGFEWPAPPAPPAPATPPRPSVSEDERLLILRMLEQKKITLEEADRLLSALEGNE